MGPNALFSLIVGAPITVCAVCTLLGIPESVFTLLRNTLTYALLAVMFGALACLVISDTRTALRYRRQRRR